MIKVYIAAAAASLYIGRNYNINYNSSSEKLMFCDYNQLFHWKTTTAFSQTVILLYTKYALV